MNFQVGDKVVCVEDYMPHGCSLPALVNGLVYCVDELMFYPWDKPNDAPGVIVSGTPVVIHPRTGLRISYRSSRFRKVSEVGHPAIEISINEPVHP